MDPKKEPGIAIAQIFLESASLAHRADSLALDPASTRADVGDIDLGITIGETADGRQGVIKVTAKTKPENNPIYAAEVTIVGLVAQQTGQENVPIGEFLTKAGVQTLFPFVREAFAHLTGRGRFGPVFINPINPAAMAEQLAKAHAELLKAKPAATYSSQIDRPKPNGRKKRRG